MGVAFRGYVLPHLHSYSPAEEVLAYWEVQPHAEHNGVFSAALIGSGGNTLTLITDVLGMGPLYYRTLGDGEGGLCMLTVRAKIGVRMITFRPASDPLRTSGIAGTCQTESREPADG